MTLNEFLHESHKILEELKSELPGTDDYQALLRDYSALCIVALNCIDVRERLSFEEENNDAPMNIVPLKPTPIVDETATVENAKAEEKEEPKMTFTELQSALTNAVRNGLAAEEVNQMITSLNYERLSDIPANLYPAVMQWLDEKVGAR